ncbi:hypothetical protein KLP40_17825 [Hymenobacter sp. NST-14]|uniref:hypothetical protein n=1 Tax=Hymenobacter piscis TaxID=2839984 RepID=UPI001C01D9E2|nr:hypothetical protein [Hymenobacter piscis]MBT9395030.1 hypothetical protein [Hymenobacter piscis]
MAKKTPESKEAAAERRQRELAALTSGVAAFSLMGDAPRPATPAPAPVEAPAPATAQAPVVPATAAVAAPPVGAKEQEGKKVASAPEPAPAPAAPVQAVESVMEAPAPIGEEPRATALPVPPAAASTPEEPDDAEADDELPASTAPVAAAGELDLTQLFVHSSEKKTTTLRITADHQQYFAQLGFILGGGASAPDIIHNILNRFRQEHEAQLQKAMKKQIRQMMAPKK